MDETALQTALRRISELEAQGAAHVAALAAKDAQIAQLEAQVKALLERLGRNSSNSSKPPSSDPPGTRAQRRAANAKARSQRKRGGQPGHDGSQRALLPPEDVDAVVDLFPPECESCWCPLPTTPDVAAWRFQTTELPPVKPYTTEYRRHAVTCSCGYTTCAPYDQVPSSMFGPRLTSVVGLLTGVYHLSRRAAASVLLDLVGVRISIGAISSIEARVSVAVKPAVDEAWQHVDQAPVRHTDGTSWFQSGVMLSLWTIATSMATVFKIIANGRKETIEKLFIEKQGLLVSDRATSLRFWAMERRQICWAHLLRKFVSFSERGGRATSIGKELLDYVGIMFAYWDDVKTGKITRDEYRQHMAPIRVHVEDALQRAVASGVDHVVGSCADILEHKAALWTFVDRDDVEPTNNHAERELRAFVLWRKRSFGTQSERGNLFAERLMTVAHTARKQDKDVLAFLTACVTATRSGATAPSLFAA